MLYITFNVLDSTKYADFQKLYEHMVTVREPGFEFEYEKLLDFDWDNMSEDEINEAVIKLSNFGDNSLAELERYQELIPDYANTFLEHSHRFGNSKSAPLSDDNARSILNYLEYDFEVDMDNLELRNEQVGIIEYSTGNFPFGGIDRFLIILKAFELIPTECFNGFDVCELSWNTDVDFDSIPLPDKTKDYVARFKR